MLIIENTIVLRDNKNVYDFYYHDVLDYALKNQSFKQRIIFTNSIIWKYNYGVM